MQNYAAGSIVDRMIRAAKLESGLYEEVERDTSATNQALTVVVIVAVLSGIGSAIAGALSARAGAGSIIGGFILGIIAAIVAWVIWSYVSYLIGTSLFGGKATYGELLRTLGFADTPGALGFFIFIPIIGGLIAFIGVIWTIVAGVIAIRQALDVDTGKAIATAVISAVIVLIIYIIVASILAVIGFGIMAIF